MLKAKIAVLVSGGGSNLQALIDSEKSGVLKSAEIALVVSNKENAYALERAKENNIENLFLENENFEENLINLISEKEIDLIVLAGFLKVLSPSFTKRFHRRIINVHPSLIPSFCGKGYYGLKVHTAALNYGVKVSGATVHFVNEIPDGGEIIMQKAVDVFPDDTPEILQKRIMEEAEWVILPKATEIVSTQIINLGDEYGRI